MISTKNGDRALNNSADVKVIPQLRVLEDIGLFNKWRKPFGFMGLARNSKQNGSEMLVVWHADKFH